MGLIGALIMIILVIVIVVLLINTSYTNSLHGVLFVGYIPYGLLNKQIKKIYLVHCYTIFGKKLNVLTRSVSHHAFLVITDTLTCIVSRIENFIQVLELKSKDITKDIVDIEGYRYNILEGFELETPTTITDFINVGVNICSKHKYSLFNHNCQEFVYDMLRHYNVVMSGDADKYEGKIKLFLKGVSEIMNQLA